MRRTLAVLVTVASITGLASPASADSDDLVGRSVVLARHQLELRLSLERNLSQRSEGRPTSLAPDAWFGITERWTVGVIHGNQSLDRILTGASFCVQQSEGAAAALPGSCDRLYRGGGLDARWRWRDGALAIAARTRLLVRDVEPWKPAATLGALVRWTRGRYALVTDPYLRLGLANRARGNRAALVVPLWLAIQPTCRWLVTLHTGVDGEVAVWRDGWHVPLALAVTARATAQLDLGVEAGFSQLFGPQNDHKPRAVIVSAVWRTR